MTQPPGYSGEPYRPQPGEFYLQPPYEQPPYEQAPYEQAPYEQTAYPQSPYPQSPYTQQPYAQQPYAQQPADPYPQQPTEPFIQNGYGYPSPPPGPTQARRSRTLIIMIVLVFVLLLGGGTTLFLMFGRSEGTGSASPAAAVDTFLTAVFRDKSTTATERATCRSARDTEAISKRVDELRQFELRYKSPTYTWPSPTVEAQKARSATVTVPITLTTSDDRVSEQRLRITTIKADGWLVL